jgi:phosphatidylglycerol:prolipoprotein diacylglycerol transferase
MPITAYGVALGVAFAVGIGVAMGRARRVGLDPDLVLEAGVVALFASLLGSRLLYAFEHPEAFAEGASGAFAILRPLPGAGVKGLSMSGGVLLAVAAVLGWLRVRGGAVLSYADVMAPSVALGEGITRIGCFLNGCCFGVACDWPWGVRFPEGSLAATALPGVALHPTQLYLSALGFAIAAVLVRWSGRRPRTGSVFFAFLVLWSIARLAVDALRHYPDAVYVLDAGGLRIAKHQLVVGGLLGTGALGLWGVRARPG